MKLIPQNLFKSKKTRSISRSENPSFGSVTTTSSSDSITTPTSVLPEIPSELIHVFQMIGTNTKIQKEEELSGNKPTNVLSKIFSEPIQDDLLDNTPTSMLPEVPSKLIQEELSGNTPTNVLSKIFSEPIQDDLLDNTSTSMLPEIPSELIMEELSSKTPTSMLPKISSELIQEELSGNTGVLPKIPSELIQAYQMIGADDAKIQLKEELELLLHHELDVNGDGCVSLQELRDTFDFFDMNHDGKITAEELFNVFSTIGGERCTLEDCRRMIRGVDKNGDGFVCFEDFCIMMEQQSKR